MAVEFRYPLTRVCLRSGALTLPLAMTGLFPAEGEITAIDTKRDLEFTLEVTGPRSVAGFGEMFRHYRLDVNDELLLRKLEDGRFAVTATAKPRRADYSSAESLAILFDELAESGIAATEAEIRALYPDVPGGVNLTAALAEDGRFMQREGRWQSAVAAEMAAGGQRRAEEFLAAKEREESEARALQRAAAGDEAEIQVVMASARDEPHEARAGAQSSLWAAPGAAASDGAGSAAGGTGSGGAQAPTQAPAHGVFERRTPLTARHRDVTPTTEGFVDDLDDERSRESLELVSRLRALLTPVGFRIEPTGRYQLTLHAEMGRRGYRALVQLLSTNLRLDWADLLARRRSLGVRYIAVVGDSRDLIRLSSPAEVARATLWSWAGLERLAALNRTVPISPFDLLSHFEENGLFEVGLTRFEAAVGARVAERGMFSEVLLRLAQLKAPVVFLLEELAGELNMSREQVLRILERLSEPPFDLVERVEQGEFVLRQSATDALEALAGYATSLRSRVPARQRERLTAVSEPDLLTPNDIQA